MSSLYKRRGSRYYMWKSQFKGRTVSKSTKMSKKSLAKLVAEKWDLDLILGNLDFLGVINYSSPECLDYFLQYLKFIEKRKSENTLANNKTVITCLAKYLQGKKVNRIDEISTKVLNDFIDSLNCSPKTKKNYLGIIRLVLKQAQVDGILTLNPADLVTLPRIVKVREHRLLDTKDLEIIFNNAGSWLLYYRFLYHTGLRAGDVAMLTGSNIDKERKAIVSFIRKSRKIYEFPISDFLLSFTPSNLKPDEPLFPALWAEKEKPLNNKLKYPRLHLQSILRIFGREKATLHSFRVTFNNILRDEGLRIEDRQVLLAHASSSTTKIYTLPNFGLAAQYINRIPAIEVAKKVQL